MPLNYLKDLGPDLIAKGYHIVPIKPGYKYPKGLKNWQNIVATQRDVDRWTSNGFSQGGVGALCGNLIGVDLDILDEEIAALVSTWCIDNLGSAPQRIGLAPKILFAFRTEDPFYKITSKTYIDIFGDLHKVEVLGEGQQFVAYAKHPDTGRPYKWVNGPGLSDIKFNDLPEITEDQAKELVIYFESIIPDEWEIKPGIKKSTKFFAEPDPDDPFAGVQNKTNITTKGIKRALEDIKFVADDQGQYDNWRTVGMGLHFEFDGSDEGFELWDDWSSGGFEYDHEATKAKWKSFSNSPGRTKTTFRAALKIRKDNKEVILKARKEKQDLRNTSKESSGYIAGDGEPQSEEKDEYKDFLEQFLERYIFIEDGSRVCDMEKPPQVCISKLDDFRNKTANVCHEIPVANPPQCDPDRTKFVPVHYSWISSTDRATAQSTGYNPGKDRVFDLGGLDYINTFYMPEFDEDEFSLGGIEVFLDHMDYLFPDEGERTWFIDWMAFNLQRPETRCKVTPLLISVLEGTGRGWLVELMERLLGSWNCTKTTLADLVGEGSTGQYNGYMSGSILCCIEEVKESEKRYSVCDKIRSVLTDNRLEVNNKYGSKGTVDIFVNFFFMSNHKDAVILPANDRRIHVLSGPDELRDENYYNQLYDWSLVPENIGALAGWLRARDISDFDWHRSSDTPGRIHMVEGGRTPTETAFWDFVSSVNKTAITIHQLTDKVQEFMEGNDLDNMADERQILRILQKSFSQASRMRVKGDRVRPWLFGKWDRVPDSEEIKKEVLSHDKG